MSAAAERVSSDVQTVATGTQETSASIQEVSQNANDAARVVGRTLEGDGPATATTAQLDSSSSQIQDELKALTSVA